MLRAQCEIRHSEPEVACINIGSIRENDYGDAIVRKALDRGVESAGIAVMPHAAVAFVFVEKPPKAVVRGGSIWQRHSSRALERA